MQRAAACLGILALAAALGALVIGQLVAVPGLFSQGSLVDLNLLTRIAAPIHLRCAEIALCAGVVLLGVSSTWMRSRLGTTLALLAVACTGTLRLVLLPTLYDTWAQVDRVAQLPHDRLMRAQGLTDEVYWLGLSGITLLVLMAVLAGLHWVTPGSRRSTPSHTPTLDDAVGSTDENPIAHAA